MIATELLSRLDGVRSRGAGKWSARCPAHADKSPSLTIAEGDRGLLVKCFAGCSLRAICIALGIEQRELFFNARDKSQRRQRPAPPVRGDRRALAFRFELAALDLRLRGERINEAGKKLDIVILTDDELDRALGHVAQAYADCERAELFEHVADELRLKECWEKKHARHERVA